MLTMTDVLRARHLLQAHLPPSPAWSYPLLDAAAGRTVVVKHENTQPTGAFKVRGALNLLAGLNIQPGTPIVTYSTGNHARSIAYAARAYGRPATIVMPEHAAGFKVQAVEALGAAALAGVLAHPALMGATVGAIVTGGNATGEELRPPPGA